MIEIYITQLIAILLLGCQGTSVIAQKVTSDNRWAIGGIGLIPFVILFASIYQFIGV